MASAYIGFALEREDSESAIVQMNAAMEEIKKSTDKVVELLKTSGLANRMVRGHSDIRAASIANLSMMMKLRDRLFGDEMFFDPAWNMLLDLYKCEMEGRRVMVSDACNASGVPPTTGLRWLKALEKRGYVVRKQDPTDGRRVFVALSTRASERMSEVTDALVRRFYDF